MSFGAGTEAGQVAQQDNAQASQQRNDAQGMYNNLSSAANGIINTGQQQQQQFSGLENQLLPQYETAAGINTNSPQTTNPYQLNSAQQTQLNTQMELINRQRQNALSASTAHAAQQGITDPNHTAAAQELINQGYNQMANDHSANFMEQARQGTLANTQNLLNFGATQAQQGTQNQLAGYGMQEGAASGVGNIAGQTQQAGNQAQQTSLQQQQMQDGITSGILGGVFKLGGAALGGAFSGGGDTAASDNNLTIPAALFYANQNPWAGADPATDTSYGDVA